MTYLADTATAAGKTIGGLLGMVLVYIILYGLYRLIKKHSPSKRQRTIFAVTAILLGIASIVTNSGKA